MEHRPRLLVVGAAEGSLGRAIYEAARGTFDATTAGVHLGDETHYLDITEHVTVHRVLEKFDPEYVVCTVGINEPYRGSTPEQYARWLEKSFQVNTIGPLAMFDDWFNTVSKAMQFVTISSNSAHIARTSSAAYCASKAALSMGIRCQAREIAGRGPITYGYEPGWLEGTPMSQAVTRRLEVQELGKVRFPRPLHRIPGGMGVDPYRLAALVVNNLRFGGAELNGTLIRIDGGEQ